MRLSRPDPPLFLVLTNTTSSASVGRGRPPTICIMVRYRALRCEYLLSAPDSADCTCATRTQNPSPRSDAVGNTANTTSTCPPRAIPQRQPSHAPYPRCGHGHSHGTGRSQTTNQDPGTHMGSCGSAAANDSCSTFLNLPHSTQLLRVRASRDINLSES